MSVAVLELEDETLVAFNLNMVSMMDYKDNEISFEHDGYIYSTNPECDSQYRRLKLHPDTLEKGNIYSAESMFDKFCNL